MTHKEIQGKVSKLGAQIETEKERLRETQKRFQENQVFLDTLAERFKKAVLSEDEKAIKALEAEGGKMQVSIKRDSALIEALKEEVGKIENELSGLKIERNTIFASLAKGWLTREKGAYDQSAKETLRRAKRLTTCYGLLREIDQSHIFMEEIPSFEHFPSIKIPTIEGFDRSDFLSGSPFKGIPAGGREEVWKEIVKEE